MKSTDISLSIPLIIKNHIIGFVNFGRKTSGKAFSEEDIDLLKTLAFQISVSIENTLLYEEENRKQEILNEFKLAENIQQYLLADLSEVKEFDIATYGNSPKAFQQNFFDLLCNNEEKLLATYISIPFEGIPAVLHLSKFQAVLQTLVSNYKDPDDIIRNFSDSIFPEFGNEIPSTLIIFVFEKNSKKLKVSSLNCKNLIFSTGDSITSLENIPNLPLKYSASKNIFNYTVFLKPDDLLLLHSESLTSEQKISKIYDIIKMNKNLPVEELKSALCKAIEFDSDAIFFTVLKVR